MPFSIPRDRNRVPFGTDNLAVVTKTITFNGGEADGVGDLDGANNPLTLFDVTGVVVMIVFAKCGTDLAGATATLEIGTELKTDAIIEQTTATDIDLDELWVDATPITSVVAVSGLTENIVAQDVIKTVGTADITSGEITFYCLWRPISEDGDVVAT